MVIMVPGLPRSLRALAMTEVYNVLLKRGEFQDLKRNRKIPYKLYYPETTEKVPVILWSHGYGGNRDGAGFIARHVASHGYILLHITHPGSDASLWEGKPGHPWDILRGIKITRDMSFERFKDVPFVLAELEAEHFEHTDILPRMNLSKLGISGHSFGALTAQIMAGQKYPDTQNHLIRMKDERFTAGIAYSPMPMDHISNAPPAEIFGSIDIPLFHMTGTDDGSPIEGFGYEKRLSVYENSGAADKYLMVLQHGNHMVYNGTRGKLEKNPNREEHENIITIASLAFWDAYLKDDAAALDWLKTNY
ncbi:MAG: alpha/beta hydrolase family protein [Alphaproteobacteria bacterium]